tara:strand:+ start:1777 stop:3591 length:1815 start_codon:yes stop_codon:yes gene_type:complete
MSIILACSRGHNSSTTLLVDGEVVFYLEEERLSRFKRDGTPLLGLLKAFEYVDHIDHLVVTHTHRHGPNCDWTGEDLYQGWIRKLTKQTKLDYGPRVTFIDTIHHEIHASCAFLNSGFKTAACLSVDGAGSFLGCELTDDTCFEFETIFKASYDPLLKFDTVYKHLGTSDTLGVRTVSQPNVYVTEYPGLTKAYEAITEYCGFDAIDAGKTMGLSPYGKENPDLPDLFRDGWVNREVFVPNYPNGSHINANRFPILKKDMEYLVEKQKSEKDKPPIEREEYGLSAPYTDDNKSRFFRAGFKDYTEVQKDLAYKIQKDTEREMIKLIQKAVDLTGEKNICISGGYGLNCVSNYQYLKHFPDLNIYVEPISHDGGTSIGAARKIWAQEEGITSPPSPVTSIYYGPQNDPNTYLTEYDHLDITDASYDSVAKLIRDGNIVTIFQGRSEGGPRALGNRSILFDPTIKNGKDLVNEVKHREFFRPFACSIKKENVHEWFNLQGREDSPHMMYAVECLPGVEKKIPSVIHVDGTCRIQTVTEDENEHYYKLISAFEKLSKVPILFNTSFNLGGYPLVETIHDAIDTLDRSNIEYMYLPELQKLVKIPNAE